MSHLRIDLLGPPLVTHADERVVFRTRKSLAVLAYLAADTRPRTREHLRTLLWPEHDTEHAGALLRRTLAFLRQSLGERAAAPTHLLAGELQVSLASGSDLSVDTQVVLAAAPRLHVATTPAETAAALAAAEQAVALYRGTFLQDFSLEDAPEFESWLEAQRVTWQQRVESLLDGLVRALVASGQVGQGLQHAAGWVDRLPTSDLAARRLIGAQLAAGLPEQARLTLDRHRHALSRELGVEPSTDVLALFESTRPQLEVHPASVAHSSVTGPLPLVGRNADLELMTRAFREVASGAMRGVLLVGEAGIGKTALAQQVTVWAAAHGADVLAGAAFETGGRLTYGAVVEALRERLAREHAPADLLDDVWLATLAHLLPELKERYPDLEPAPLQDELAQLRLFEAVARLLESLGARAPLVWLLDDVQWTDTGTRDLLLYLVRRWTRTPQPVLLLLTLRAEARANDPSLQRWMRELRRVGGIAERTLGALTQPDLSSLLVHLTTSPGAPETIAAWADWLFAETGGQPFYVVETLRALREQHVLPWDEDADGRWQLASLPVDPGAVRLQGGVPSSVRDLIQSRLDGLGDAARALVAVGAVLGGRMRLDALAGMLGRTDDALIGALDELLRVGVWLEAPPATTGRRTPRYVFAHDRIHDVAYASLGSARRQSLHRNALTVLQGIAAEPAELARHAREGDLPDVAFDCSVAAGDASMGMFAVADALVEYEQAHALLSAQDDQVSSAASLLPRLGRAYEVAHRLPEARAVHQELLALAHAAGAPRLESQALTALGTLTMHERWDSDAAVELIHAAAEIAAASGEIAAQAESEWSLAQIHAYAHGRELAVEHATRAVALARTTGNPDLQARSLNALAMGHLILGHATQCADAARESLALFRAAGNDLMSWDSQRLLAASAFQLAEPRTTLSLAREALEGCTRAHNVWGQAWGAKEVVHALLDLGALEEAVDVARRAVDAARALDDPVGLCMALTLLCRAYRRTGDVARARTAALEALEWDASVPTRPLRESVLADLAACAVTDAEWDAAARYAHEALQLRDGTLYLDTGLTRWMETAALVRAGQADEAEADLCRWSQQLDGCPRYRLPYLRARAELADWKQQPAEADDYRARAQELARQWRLAGELAAFP